MITATTLAYGIVFFYAFVFFVTAITILEGPGLPGLFGPAFERMVKDFTLRNDHGVHEMFISAKPAPIKWEEPEAYILVYDWKRPFDKFHVYGIDSTGQINLTPIN